MGRTAVVVLLLLSFPVVAAAQEGGDLDEARSLRDAGELERAIDALEGILARSPDDVDARWLLAQTLYWTGDVERARSEYARAVAGRPDDPGLRLDAARFLLETGRAKEAGGVLAPLIERPPPGWEGELARTRREIAALAAPWVRVAPEVDDDSQPLTAWGVEVDAGWWPAEGVSLGAKVDTRRYDGEDAPPGADPQETTFEAEAVATIRPPASPIALDLSGGVFDRSDLGSTDFVGHVVVAARLPEDVTISGEASRRPYLKTVSSLTADIFAEGVEVRLDRAGAPGWAFEAGGRRETYGDDNAVGSAWAWVLAPLLVRDANSLRIGYAFRWQDSEETRFTTGGFYDPYYTPEEIFVHSAIAAVAVRAGPDVSLFLDGAVAISAEETAPAVGAGAVPDPPGGPGPPGPPEGPDPPLISGVVFSERDFTPWRVRASLVAGLGSSGELRATIERTEEAFFEWTHGSVSITWWPGR